MDVQPIYIGKAEMGDGYSLVVGGENRDDRKGIFNTCGDMRELRDCMVHSMALVQERGIPDLVEPGQYQWQVELVGRLLEHGRLTHLQELFLGSAIPLHYVLSEGEANRYALTFYGLYGDDPSVVGLDHFDTLVEKLVVYMNSHLGRHRNSEVVVEGVDFVDLDSGKRRVLNEIKNMHNQRAEFLRSAIDVAFY